MSRSFIVQVEIPGDLRRFRLPKRMNRRLQDLLDKQDRGEALSSTERKDAEELVDLAEVLSLLKLRAQLAAQQGRAQS